jgi:hypothetical protein
MSSHLTIGWKSDSAALSRTSLRVAEEAELHEAALTRSSHAEYLVRKLQYSLAGGGIASGGYVASTRVMTSHSERRDTQVAAVTTGCASSASCIGRDQALDSPRLRYEKLQEADGSWTVYDTFSNLPAKPSTWALVDLPVREADIYCAIINEKDRPRQRHFVSQGSAVATGHGGNSWR